MKTVVVASGLNQIDDLTDFSQFQNYASYPGSVWYQALAEEANDHGLKFIGVNAAIALIKSGFLSPQSILLIQERESDAGNLLLSLGARGAVLTCLESPIYASKFYSRLDKISVNFFASFLFPQFVEKSKSIQSKNIFFPRSYDKRNEILNIKFQDRVGFAVVATYRANPAHDLSVRARIGLLFNAIQNAHVRQGLCNHLLKSRTKVIAAVANLDEVFIYGRNWPSPIKLVPETPEKVVLAGLCKDKILALRKHKFNICLENCAIPGYVTEKFADAVEAGCVPIYDKNNFKSMDIRKFPPFIDVNELLNSNNPANLLSATANRFDEWLMRPKALDEFLDLFSHIKFARQVMEAIEQCLNLK